MTRTGKQNGFTLIELMITIVVLGVLASIAVPTYTQYVQSARRADARLALLQVSNQLEKFYSNNLTYTSNLSSLGVSSASPDEFYNIQIVSVSNASYRIVATADSGGKQFKDTTCREFSLDSSGVEAAENAAGSATTADCW